MQLKYCLPHFTAYFGQQSAKLIFNMYQLGWWRSFFRPQGLYQIAPSVETTQTEVYAFLTRNKDGTLSHRSYKGKAQGIVRNLQFPVSRCPSNIVDRKSSDTAPLAPKKKEPKNPFADGGGPGSESAAMGWSPSGWSAPKDSTKKKKHQWSTGGDTGGDGGGGDS